jgi:isoamylase
VEHEEKRAALDQLLHPKDITWHGVKLGEPDWRHASHSIAFTVSRMGRTRYHVILNAY